MSTYDFLRFMQHCRLNWLKKSFWFHWQNLLNRKLSLPCIQWEICCCCCCGLFCVFVCVHLFLFIFFFFFFFFFLLLLFCLFVVVLFDFCCFVCLFVFLVCLLFFTSEDHQNYTVSPLYTDTRYNDKIRNYWQLERHETFAQEMTVNETLCKNIALKLQATYVLDIC